MEVSLDKSAVTRFLLPFLLIAYLFGQGLHADFERMIFWGEFISLLLFFTSFRTSYNHDFQQKIILGIYIWVLLFPVYAVMISYFLWEEQVNAYYMFRHLSYFYYALFFFGGYQFGPSIIQMLSRYWLNLLLIFLFAFFTIGASVLIIGFVWLVCQKGNPKKWFFYIVPCGLLLLLASIMHHGTSKAMGLFLLCSPLAVYFLKIWNQTVTSSINKILVRFSLLTGAVVLVYLANSLLDSMYAVASTGGSFHVFFDEFSSTDSNGVWRIMLWTYLFGRLKDCLLGIGIGTPLVTGELANFMYLIQKPGDEYTSGAHNSFITFLVRLGIPFLVFFVMMSFYSGRLIMDFLKKVQFKVFDTAENRFAFTSILVFFLVVIQACFNVVLESPVYAGFFWFYFGLFVRVVGDFEPSTQIADASKI